MKRIVLVVAISIIWNTTFSQNKDSIKKDDAFTISKELLKNKIKGAWAASTIGVSFGLPVEFKHNSTMVQDYMPLVWNDSSMHVLYRDFPGTYDDIYMDLTFMEVIEKEGVDAPAKSFASAIANKDYSLWFANQTARYNIINGLAPPASGHWLNNPCADDIDFQIEADFAGLMYPGMVNSAIELCDKVGHIMNYGDGYYGGVFVAALYTQALISNSVTDIKPIIEKAIKVIPEESKFAQCINDVIKWHEEDPTDWQMTWFKTYRKWGMDIGSPLGVFEPFNIDAKINAAWVVVGLLYGEGDYTRTFEIATRCGDDADCNPATAGGVLTALLGYNNIPEFWLQGLNKVEHIPFMGTSVSLLDAYDMSFRHAEKMIMSNGGKLIGDDYVIKVQKPKTIPLEVSFKGHYPKERIVPQRKGNEITFEFEGIGFALAGPANGVDHGDKKHVFEAEMYIDGKLIEKVKLPTEINKRRFTPFWKYDLPNERHTVSIIISNPVDYAEVEYKYAIIYGDKPFKVNLK